MVLPAKFRRMTVGERMKAGIGAVGPRHPKMRQFMQKMGSSAATSEDPEPESDDEPMPDSEESEAPNLRNAECCGNCAHYDSEEMQCGKHDCGCEPTDTCDDFEEGTEDEEQGADMSGEY